MDGWLKPYGNRPWYSVVFDKLNSFLDGGEDAVILEAGCGNQCRISQTLRNQGRSVRTAGIDIDEGSPDNPNIGEFRLVSVCDIPLEPDPVHVVVSSSVIEHVDDPLGAFRERPRVPKPGRMLMMWTPSICNPIMVFSRSSSHECHLFARRLAYGAEHADNAPTYYRLRTRRRLRAAARARGFALQTCQLLSEAHEYFARWKGAYLVACLFSKLACLWPTSLMRLTILCTAEKPAGSAEVASTESLAQR